MPGGKGTIAILTGGGDVPGLNPAIRAVTIRAEREGYRILGIRRGWRGLVDLVPDPGADNSKCVQELTGEVVQRVGRTGGTFLHSSRTRASRFRWNVAARRLKRSSRNWWTRFTRQASRLRQRPCTPKAAPIA